MYAGNKKVKGISCKGVFREVFFKKTYKTKL